MSWERKEERGCLCMFKSTGEKRRKVQLKIKGSRWRKTQRRKVGVGVVRFGLGK